MPRKSPYPKSAPKATPSGKGYPRETYGADKRYQRGPFPHPYDSVGPAPWPKTGSRKSKSKGY